MMAMKQQFADKREPRALRQMGALWDEVVSESADILICCMHGTAHGYILMSLACLVA